MQEVRIEHLGSRVTDTIFLLPDKSMIKISVSLDTSISVSQNITAYRYRLLTKKKGCRNWNFEYSSGSDGPLTKERERFNIDDKTLYRAFYNHWNKLNPFRIFSNGSINNDLTFPVELDQLIAVTKHKAY